MISPAEFIPIAEDCGIIRDIGAWVLHQACTQAMAWLASGLRPTTMAVNVSAVEFRDDKFLSRVFDTLEKTGMHPGSLDLELTEGVLMNRAELTAPILQALRNRGVQVSVDDFGTGYSSLSYLQKFPLDALKIDQSFVREINLSGGNTAIVTAIIAMARNLGLRVVAEGVETGEQLAFLQSHQCDEAQGYYLGRPMPPEEFAKLLGRVFKRT
jgi:EAL domain-containing protein (putative c-di-GMP-specific phosphodiesterase class I)